MGGGWVGGGAVEGSVRDPHRAHAVPLDPVWFLSLHVLKRIILSKARLNLELLHRQQVLVKHLQAGIVVDTQHS